MKKEFRGWSYSKCIIGDFMVVTLLNRSLIIFAKDPSDKVPLNFVRSSEHFFLEISNFVLCIITARNLKIPRRGSEVLNFAMEAV